MECYRGTTNRSINYTQWFDLNAAQHALAPSLVPMFELVDHGTVPNCEIDVLMRPLLPDGTVDHALTDDYIALLLEREDLCARVTKTNFRSRERRRTGIKHVMAVINKIKRVADKAQRAIVGETEGTSVEGDDPLGLKKLNVAAQESEKRREERAKRRTEVLKRLDELEESLEKVNVQPVLELRSTQPITAGTPLSVHYALLHSRPFTLYRFGFEPV